MTQMFSILGSQNVSFCSTISCEKINAVFWKAHKDLQCEMFIIKLDKSSFLAVKDIAGISFFESLSCSMNLNDYLLRMWVFETGKMSKAGKQPATYE